MAYYAIHAKFSPEILHQLTASLQLRGGHLLLLLVVALEADADGAPVAALGVRAYRPERATTNDRTILIHEKVVANASPAPVEMPAMHIVRRAGLDCGVVQDNQVRYLTGGQLMRPVVFFLDDVH